MRARCLSVRPSATSASAAATTNQSRKPVNGNVAADWIAPRTPPCCDDLPCETEAVAPRTPLDWVVPPVVGAGVPAAVAAVTCDVAVTLVLTVLEVPALVQ